MHPTWSFASRFATDVAWKATFLFAVTGLLMLASRRGSAAGRHRIGVLGLGASLLLPILALVPGRLPLPLFLPKGPEFLRGGSAGLAVALGVWALGALTVSARLLVGWRRVRAMGRDAEPVRDAHWIAERDVLARRLDVRRPVALMESAAVPVAMTAGLLRPLLLVGRAARLWAVERRRVVLLHELAHVKRSDWASALLAEFAVALYWFHPLAWWIGRRVRRDAERASDDLVISVGIKPSVYAGHLLGIFRSLGSAAHPVAPALAAIRPSHFEERLRAILDPAAPRVGLPAGSGRWAAAGIFAALVGVAALDPSAPPRATTCPGAARSPSATTHASIAAASGPSAPAPRAGAPDGELVPAASSGDEAGSPRAGDGDSAEASSAPDAVVHAIRMEGAKMAAGFVQASNGRRSRSGEEWYDRGQQLHRDERYPEAIEAFEKAIAAGYREDASSYNIACGYALMGNADSAFEWLERARQQGFDLAAYVGEDDDLDNLRSDARWAQLKQSAREEKTERHAAKGQAAAARYERLVAKAPPSGEPFFQSGRELLSGHRYDLAAAAFQAAAERGYRPGTALYNQACALSLGGDRAGALDRLSQALDAGFDQPDMFRTDDDLDAVRDDPRFASLAREARELSLPGYGGGWWQSHRSVARWRESARRFEGYAKEHPRSGRAWYNVGFASLAAERPEAAADAFRKALELGYRKPTTMYNLACSYSRLDRKDEAFDWLFRSLEAGFDETGTLRNDDDLDNLRGDPRYRKALEAARIARRRVGSD